MFPVALVLALLMLAPGVPADRAHDRATGVNGGYVQAGVWDVFHYDKTGGTSTAVLDLRWEQGLFPGADYDLHLYRPGALDDGVLERSELVAASETRSFTHRQETIVATLSEGKHVVAVVPWQAQEEPYTLDANPGWLNKAAIAPGVQAFCPLWRCPLV